jgi:prepilin-type N-terminal cleavage/methylation domain-containing protein
MSKQGFTLTELLVVMGMTSVVLTVGVGMLHRVMHEQKVADRENAMHRVAERLSTKLREDVHLATNAELVQSDEGAQLVLKQLDETTVTYLVRKNVLDRTSSRESKPTHRDRFEFPNDYQLEFSGDPAKRVSFTAFAVPQTYVATAGEESQSVVSENDVRRAVTQVEASVGRDHRFLSKPKE